MYQRMPRSSTLNLTQANQVSAFKVAVAMLELPNGGVWSSMVEDIAHFLTMLVTVGNQLHRETPYLCEIRTC